MKLKSVIKKAILSEKAYKQMEKGIYTFLVVTQATKNAVAKQVFSQFGVDVMRVNMTNIAPKTKRVAKTRKQVKTGGGKKAIVYLKSGQTIAMLMPKSETKGKKPKDKDKGKEKDIQKAEGEKEK